MPVLRLKMDEAGAAALARVAALRDEKQGQVLMRGVAVLQEIEDQKKRGKRPVFIPNEPEQAPLPQEDE